MSVFLVAAGFFLIGVIVTLLVQSFVLYRWIYSLPVTSLPYHPQFESFSLPKELIDQFNVSDQKEEKCFSMNLIAQFLFQELKDEKHVRRWAIGRMNVEFKEMLQTTTGRLLEQITVRDFNMGKTFPVVKQVRVEKIELRTELQQMEELSLIVDISYSGGFHLAVDVDLVFGKSAYLSVKVTGLSGMARLQFTRQPFTHWSFAFVQEPSIEFEVDSHFEGRSIQMSQIRNLIVNQIRRTIRKKHTLPNYKLRFKPFFFKTPANDIIKHDLIVDGDKISVGSLTVKVVQCSRLMQLASDTYIYCTLALDSIPWAELMSSQQRLWVSHEVEISKAAISSLTFKEECIAECYEDVVVVDHVELLCELSRGTCDIRRGDIVESIGGSKVTNVKQANRLLKHSRDSFVLRVKRSSRLKGHTLQDFKFEEDTVSVKTNDENDIMELSAIGLAAAEDDFVNISVATDDRTERLIMAGDSVSPSAKRPFSILSSRADVLFKRRRSALKSTDESAPPPPPPSVPDTRCTAELVGGEPVGTVRSRRTRSEPPNIAKLDELGDQMSTEIATDAISECATSGVECAEDVLELKKTTLLAASSDPLFNESFRMDVDEQHRFLNVCVWCKIPLRLDKQNRIVKQEKDIPIGHVSIPVMDVALECLMTLQNVHRQCYNLSASEMKAGASRSKLHGLVSHPGFDERLCNGDITLEFSHSRPPERRVSPCAESDASAESCELQSPALPAEQRPLEPGQHHFVGSQFQSSTYCHFCQKKIWLKVAFRCCACGMICHKKCTERCQATTICTKQGMEWKPGCRPPSPPVPVARRYTERAKTSARAAFLSKFRRDTKTPTRDAEVKSYDDDDEKKSELLEVPPTAERKRRNSAPNESQTSSSSSSSCGGEPGADGGDASPPARTKSTTSLDELADEHDRSADGAAERPQSRRQDSVELDDSVDTESLESEFGELNLLRAHDPSADEVAINAARQLGRDLFSDLDGEGRREKLDAMVNGLQENIDQLSECRAELAHSVVRAESPEQRLLLREQIEKMDEKIQSQALLLLHYLSGLQQCADVQADQAGQAGSAE